MSDHVLHFTIPGPPSSKERPRVQTKDHRTGRPLAKPRVYTPDTTSAYEERVGWAALAAARRDHVPPFTGWAELELWIYLETRGAKDGDNVQKAIADALQKVGTFANDKQLLDWGVHLRPLQGSQLVEPCVLATVRESSFQGEFPTRRRRRRLSRG